VLLYQGDSGRPRAHHILTDTTPTQRRLFNLFDLNNYAPTRLTWVIHDQHPNMRDDQPQHRSPITHPGNSG